MYGTLVVAAGLAFTATIVLLMEQSARKRKWQAHFDYWEKQHRLLKHQPQLCSFFIRVGKSFRKNPVLVRGCHPRMFELYDADKSA